MHRCSGNRQRRWQLDLVEPPGHEEFRSPDWPEVHGGRILGELVNELEGEERTVDAPSECG